MKEENKTVNKDKITLENYEKVGNWFYKLDKWGGKSFTFSIILFFFLGYFSYISINYSPKTPNDIWFYNNVLPITLRLLLYTSTILLVASIILMYSGLGYAKLKSKKYDKNEIIRLYLYELSSNPDILRKWEILKHLTYNLIKLKEETTWHFNVFSNYHWKPYKRIGRVGFKFKSNVIDKVITFIEDAIVFLDLGQYKNILPEIGECIKKNDYRGIAKIFINNKDLLNKIEEMKKETKMMRLKTGLTKVKYFFEWISIYGRNWISMIILIILFILFLLGRIQIPPIP